MRTFLKRWLRPEMTVKDLNWSTAVNLKIAMGITVFGMIITVASIVFRLIVRN